MCKMCSAVVLLFKFTVPSLFQFWSQLTKTTVLEECPGSQRVANVLIGCGRCQLSLLSFDSGTHCPNHPLIVSLIPISADRLSAHLNCSLSNASYNYFASLNFNWWMSLITQVPLQTLTAMDRLSQQSRSSRVCLHDQNVHKIHTFHSWLTEVHLFVMCSLLPCWVQVSYV